MNQQDRHNERLSGMLRRLPPRVPPPGLTAALRVIASREIVRRRMTVGVRLGAWIESLRFRSEALMRPLALPAAGGLFSAIALFSTWVVPTYPLRASSQLDVPTMLTTMAAVRGAMPIGLDSGSEAIVDVTIDDQGRMVDYKVVAGAAIVANKTLRHRLENTLLFTEFIPATSFGKPLSNSVVRVSLVGLSRVDVKG